MKCLNRKILINNVCIAARVTVLLVLIIVVLLLLLSVLVYVVISQKESPEAHTVPPEHLPAVHTKEINVSTTEDSSPTTTMA